MNFRDPYGEDIADYNLNWLYNASDAAAGFGDTISGGMTSLVRDILYDDDFTDKCSAWYKGGEYAGYAYEAATAAAAAAEMAAAKLAERAAQRAAREAAELARQNAKRVLTEAEKKLYGRVKHPKGFREEVWERAKTRDGNVYDPNGRTMKYDEPWELGHTPEQKFTDAQRRAAEEGWSRNSWRRHQNDPDNYRPERPSSNASHKWE